MSAMDKMFAQMLGINPAELGAMVEDFRNGIVKLGEQLNRMESKLDQLEKRALEYDDRNNGGNNRKRGRATKSGDCATSGDGNA